MVKLSLNLIRQYDKNIINIYYKKLYLKIIGLVVYQVHIYMLMDYINLKIKVIFVKLLVVYVVWVVHIKLYGHYYFVKKIKIQILLNKHFIKKI